MKRHGWRDGAPRTELDIPAVFAGAADTERGARIDAERVTAEWRTRNPRNIDGGKLPIDESPLFGGRKQEELF